MTSAYDETDIQAVLAGLAALDAQERAETAAMLAQQPSGEPRVMRALASLLEDRSVALLQQFSLYGEVRLLAAVTLTAERHATGNIEPVRLRSAPALQCASSQDYSSRRERGELPERDFCLRRPVNWDELVLEPAGVPTANVPASAPAPVAPPAREPAPASELEGDEIAAVVDALERGSLLERVSTLQVLSKSPTGNERIRGCLQGLLEERVVSALMVPHRYGELRLLAGAALAAEQHAAGLSPTVRLRSTPLLSADDVSLLAEQAGLPRAPIAEQYARLRERGLIAEREYVLAHPAHLGWS